MAENSADVFDACREWLGIERNDLGNAMRVLGLPDDESDPLRVIRAAEARLVHLKGLAAGPHHAAREALILRVEQARESALTRIASNPTATNAAPPYAMPPPPRQTQRAAADPDGRLPGSERGTVASAEVAALPRVIQRRPVARRRGSGALWFSGLMVAASVAVFAAFIWWQSQKEAARQAAVRLAAKETAAKIAAERDAAADDEPARSRMPSERKNRETTADRSATSANDAAVSTSPPPRSAAPQRDAVAAAPRRPADSTPPIDRDDDPMAAPADGDTVAVTTSADGSESAPTDDMADVEAPPVDADAAEADGASDAMTELTEANTAVEAADDSTVVDGPVAEALEALQRGDFDLADDVLASALADAGPIPAKQRVADWQVLARCARDFAEHRQTALAEVRSGHEYDVNGKKVAVVESDGKRFVYRFQGKNRACEVGKIPAGIVLAIVTDWFDERPANHLFLGAWHATKPEPDLERAREHWETAERGGIDAGRLLRLLDDPAILAAVPAGDGDHASGEP